PRYDPDLRPVPRARESRRGDHLRVPGPQDHSVRTMGAHVEVRRGIRSASGRAELWRGLRRRLDEYSLTLRLLLKRPLAAAGLLITLLYVGIAIAASFLPDRDVLQRNFTTLNLSLLILWWPPYARLVRSQVLAVKANMFVEAARAAGASDLRIMFRHILPNTLAPVFVQVSLDLGVVIQIFAALIFIG